MDRSILNNNRPPAILETVQLTALQQQEVRTVVDHIVNNCLWYRIQCCDCDQAAEILGVEPDTVRDWIKRGKLAASKPGNSYLIRLCDIDSMLSAQANVIVMDHRRKRKIS